MTLPNADLCWIPDAKLSGYLLSLRHADGAPKANFFATFGFPLDRPEVLEQALLDHASVNTVISSRQTKYGQISLLSGIRSQTISAVT